MSACAKCGAACTAMLPVVIRGNDTGQKRDTRLPRTLTVQLTGDTGEGVRKKWSGPRSYRVVDAKVARKASARLCPSCASVFQDLMLEWGILSERLTDPEEMHEEIAASDKEE